MPSEPARAERIERWGARFGAPVPVIAEELRTCALALADDGSSAGEATVRAGALGVLRAQQGLSVGTVAEDVLSLRSELWGALVEQRAADDPAALLLLHTRLCDVVDDLVRSAVDAHVEEVTRIIEHRAALDPVTGLVNRAGFDDVLTAACAEAESPALLLLDLDGFKAVNDTMGHLAGDRVLRAVADVLRATTRPRDTVGRVGGDEMAVLLVRTDVRGATRVARRILAEMRDHAALATAPPTFGASVGVAIATPGDTPFDLFARADQALYEAKRSGGHRLALAPVPEAP